MPRARKTVSLREMVEWVNERNATSSCPPDVRQGWNSLVSTFLMEGDAYAGFGYLRADELEGDAVGQLPGIVPSANGKGQHAFPDETRIRFYVHKDL